jgi:hypothetical protein
MLALFDLLRRPTEHTRHVPSKRNPVINAIWWSYPDVVLLVCLQSKFRDDSLPDKVVPVVPLRALSTSSRNC